jgi:sugar O-acyltransferase (sialic acid O-acetyltransferase NeuD family)
VQLLGAGGHAAVVLATLVDAGFEVVAVLDDHEKAWGRELFGRRVDGPLSKARERAEVPAIIGVGDNAARQRIAASLELDWLSLVHPRAYVHTSVAMAEGSVVFAGAVVQPRATIGAHAIVNTSASVDHDCVVGAFAHVGPGCHLCGEVSIGTGALLGVGAVARPGARVDEWATVGAGAAVVGTIPPRAIAVGVPARVKR